MKTKVLKDTFLEDASKPLIDIVEEANNEILSIIAKRINKTGKMSQGDVRRLTQMARVSDIKAIENVLKTMVDKYPKACEKYFEALATKNDDMAKAYYEYRGISQVAFAEHAIISDIVYSTIRQQQGVLLNLAQTSAFKIDGTSTNIRDAYIKAIDKAVFTVQQGYTDYNTAIKKVVREMSANGLQTVDYASGYSMRMDSAVRMNVLDGSRQMTARMREQQANEYGADAWEISAHGLCRPSHLAYQGRVFTFEEFEKINSTELASNPIATGQYNCHHTRFGVIKGVTTSAYSKDELKELNDYSQKKVTVTGLDGKDREMSRYDASQVQRRQETRIRSLESQKSMFDISGNKAEATRLNQIIEEQKAYYKKMSKKAGLTPRYNRL